METRDHKLLAEFLLSGCGAELPYIYGRAFLIGNLEPDRNPFTYLRGITKKEKFRGHNYENVLPVMRKLFDALQKKQQLGVLDYYQLGKLMHYVTDSFTFPHNQLFRGSIREHCRYERELHRIFSYQILEWKQTKGPMRIFRQFEHMESLHEEYLEKAGLCEMDCSYIRQAAEMMLHLILSNSEIHCPWVGNDWLEQTIG